MNTDNSTIQLSKPSLTEQPVFLWLAQAFQRVQRKPFLQEKVLDKVVNQMKADENLFGILLFGSVASKTHTWKSDIDLIFIYKDHQPASGLVEVYVDKVEVQYFFTTLDILIQNLASVPYLLHLFCDGKILFDRHETVAPVIDQLRGFFDAHPEIEAEWVVFKKLHQLEKNGPECTQTTIIERWDELEAKYSGGTRKRTFFRM